LALNTTTADKVYVNLGYFVFVFGCHKVQADWWRLGWAERYYDGLAIRQVT